MSIGAIKALTNRFKFKKVNFNFPRWHAYEHENWDQLDAILDTYITGGGIQGIWANSTSYAVNDRIIDTDVGAIFTCKISHVSAAAPTTFAADRTANPTYWEELNVEEVTNAQLADMPTARLKGRATAGTGDPEDLTTAQVRSLINVFPHGQCQLRYINAGELRLFPFNGNKLTINGVPETVPDAGVILLSAGRAVGLWYVYAHMVSGVMTLYADGIAPVDGVAGVKHYPDQATHTFVGIFYLRTTATFEDSDLARLVASWFNRRARTIRGVTGAGISISSSTDTEVTNTRAHFVTWGDESVFLSVSGHATHSGVGYVNASVGLDGVVQAKTIASSNAASDAANCGVAIALTPAIGYHYTAVLGATNTGTATYTTFITGVVRI